ncbi:hypothetical protein [Kitasatospora sp. McL0602]|uniref:hypothetical protein n=1 Tax=Kitasatospora sp. McL0602 TaxID=3439530 RepID=UPI003F8B854D
MPTEKNNDPVTSTDQLERARAKAGMLVVLGSDVAIAVAAVLGVFWLRLSGDTTNGTEIAAVLTSAFTAIGTMTTAYFGIKSMSNTALSMHRREPDAVRPVPTSVPVPPEPAGPVGPGPGSPAPGPSDSGLTGPGPGPGTVG